MNGSKVVSIRPGENSKKQKARTSRESPVSSGYNVNEKARLQAYLADVQRIRLSAKRELELARKIRIEAEKYQQDTETKARSQAQLLILQARLATQKEIAELKQKTSEELQKVLAGIRMIRITAQEELETQRKFTNAARIRALSLKLQKEEEKPEKETATV